MKKLISATLAAIMIATTLVGSTCYANEDVIASADTDVEQEQMASSEDDGIRTEELARLNTAVSTNALEAAITALKARHGAVLAALKGEFANTDTLAATMRAATMSLAMRGTPALIAKMLRPATSAVGEKVASALKAVGEKVASALKAGVVNLAVGTAFAAAAFMAGRV